MARKPLMMLHDCVMGLISPGCTVSVSSTGLGSGAGVGMLAGMLGTVVPAVSRRISKATWIGELFTPCWRGGFIDGVTGGVTAGGLG